MLNCCDGNCNQGRSCPARLAAEKKTFKELWLDRLIGVGSGALVVGGFLAIVYCFLLVMN